MESTRHWAGDWAEGGRGAKWNPFLPADRVHKTLGGGLGRGREGRQELLLLVLGFDEPLLLFPKSCVLKIQRILIRLGTKNNELEDEKSFK